jgi:small subunit ribosomal protein S17
MAEQTNAQSPAKSATAEGASAERGQRRTLIGRISSAKMQKTVVVEVVRSVRHPVYGKYVRVRNKYKAHDEKGEFRAGDLVEIREARRLSRDKRWVVTKLLERPAVT